MFAASTRILIIDDMKTMRKLVVRACQQLGFSTFVEAEDGVKAWEALHGETKIDLVISDWNMPNCTGLELLKKVRADEKLKGVPFLLLTAESEASQVVTALQAGVDNYLVKPFAVDDLRKKLEQVYRKRNPTAA